MTRITKAEAILYFAAFLGYVGLAAFFAAFWQNMGGNTRIIATLGGGMLFHVLAMMAWQSAALPTRLPGCCLFAAAAFLEAVGLYVLVAQIFPQLALGSAASLAVMLFMAAQETAVYMQYRIPFILTAPIIFLYGFAFILLHMLGGEERAVLLCLGVSLLLVGHGLRRTVAYALSPAAYVLGCCLFYATLFNLVRGSWAEIAYVAAIAAGFTAAFRLRSEALLWSGTAFTIAYIAYGDTAYIMHSALWSLSLPLLGIVVFFCLTAALKAKRRYLS